MRPFRTILVASAILAFAAPAVASAAKSDAVALRSDEISAAQQRRAAPVQNTPPRIHRGFADPSFGPDGKPYPVPENLRNQCYIDEGYGRFSACSFRN
jgi:hypothetical protein